jgi:hypothetical protein
VCAQGDLLKAEKYLAGRVTSAYITDEVVIFLYGQAAVMAVHQPFQSWISRR